MCPGWRTYYSHFQSLNQADRKWETGEQLEGDWKSKSGDAKEQG
jgi:hypothetical protein